MSDFISWVEKKDETTGQLDYFYLTDEEIWGERGRDLFRDCLDSDCLGHGAARLYFGRDGEMLQGGQNQEITDFWNTEKLPPEIAAKVQNFDAYWGKSWQFFRMDNLCHILINAPEEWKIKAWEEIKKREPDNVVLGYIICRATGKWRARARKLLDG